MPDDLKVTVVAEDGGRPLADFSGAREVDEGTGALLRQQRDRVVGRAAHQVAQAEVGAEADAEAEKPIEDVDSVEVQLPNGRVVDFGPQRGVSHRVKIAQIMGNRLNPILTDTIQIILDIRSIDGRPPRALGNDVDVAAVANQLGDDGIDVLMMVRQEYWPPIDRTALPVLKKNLR